MMDAVAISTLLDVSWNNETHELWKMIVEVSASAGLKFVGNLHLSWMVAEGYHQQRLTEELRLIAESCCPIQIHSTGLGIFSAPQPVLYLPIVKTEEMLALHRVLSNRLSALAINSMHYYDADQWLPHITIANETASLAGICRTAEQLMCKPLVLTFEVDHLAVVYRKGTESGIIQSFPFGGTR